MITADFVFKLIDHIANRFVSEEEGFLSRWCCEEEVPGEVIDFVLDNEIKMALSCLNVKNQVEAVSVYEHEEFFTVFSICISFIIDGEVYQKVIVAHEC